MGSKGAKETMQTETLSMQELHARDRTAEQGRTARRVSAYRVTEAVSGDVQGPWHSGSPWITWL